MALNFQLDGKTYEPVICTITAEEIASYARASGDDNPRYAIGPDQMASPIFPVVPGLSPTSVVAFDPELGVGNPLAIVLGEQEIVHHRPTRAGDTLVLTPSLVKVEDKGRGATFVARVSATTVEGEAVNDQYATIVVRGGGSGAERAASARHEPTRGPVAASFTSRVEDGMPARYAEASGDHNPIHLDPAVATAVGLPGVINHGLGTLSLVTGGLVRQVVGGDPERVRRVAVRFTGMVIPGTDLTTVVWESDESAFGFETTRPDGTVVLVGSLEVV